MAFRSIQSLEQLVAARALFKNHACLRPVIETAFEAAALNLKQQSEFHPSQFIRTRLVVNSPKKPTVGMLELGQFRIVGGTANSSCVEALDASRHSSSTVDSSSENATLVYDGARAWEEVIQRVLGESAKPVNLIQFEEPSTGVLSRLRFRLGLLDLARPGQKLANFTVAGFGPEGCRMLNSQGGDLSPHALETFTTPEAFQETNIGNLGLHLATNRIVTATTPLAVSSKHCLLASNSVVGSTTEEDTLIRNLSFSAAARTLFLLIVTGKKASFVVSEEDEERRDFCRQLGLQQTGTISSFSLHPA